MNYKSIKLNFYDNSYNYGSKGYIVREFAAEFVGTFIMNVSFIIIIVCVLAHLSIVSYVMCLFAANGDGICRFLFLKVWQFCD